MPRRGMGATTSDRNFMINRAVLFLSFALCLSVQAAHGQTSSDLDNKYGPAIKGYEVRRGILLTARYAASGQVCEMVLENRHKSESGFELGESLTDQVVGQLIDELVPTAERGEKVKAYGWSINLGLGMQTSYSYENVEIISAGTKSSKHIIVFIKWKTRQCK